MGIAERKRGASNHWLFASRRASRWPWFLSATDCDEFADSKARQAPALLIGTAIILLHVASSWLGYLLISGGSQVTPVFPEAGLDLVVVVVFGPRCWPVLLSCYFATALWRHVSWMPSVGVAVAGVFRTITAAWLFCRMRGPRKALGEFADLAGIAAAAVIAPGLPAAFGTACLVFGGRFPTAAWQTVLDRWWIADALGILTVAPLLIMGARSWREGWPQQNRSYVSRASAYGCVVAAVSYVIFFHPGTPGILFVVFVLILIAAAWFGPGTARLAALIIAGAVIWATHSGAGAFVGGTASDNLQNLDLFLAAISLTGLAIGAFRSKGNLLLPGLVLLAGWALSGWLYGSLESERAGYNEARLDRIVAAVDAALQGRLKTYEEVLWAAAGYLAASGPISPAQWHIYIGRQQLLQLYPGTTAISIVQPVPQDNLKDFVKDHDRRSGWPEFTPHEITGGARVADGTKEHLLVVCAEPAEVAARAIGADLASDRFRQIAAERARDSGMAVLTRSTMLGDGSGRGLQLFVPVYRDAAPLSTQEDRRHALVAWVSIVFSADVFLRATLGGIQNILSLRVYEGERTAPGDLLFSSAPLRAAPGPPERIGHLALGETRWTLAWRRSPRFPYVSRRPAAWAAGCTALLSLLLAGLVATLQAARRQAADRLQLIQSALPVGTWDLDFKYGVIHCSEQFLRLYGINEPRETLSMDEWLRHVHPEDREPMLEEFAGQEGDRKSIDRQYRALWSDGSPRWLHRKAFVIFDHSNEPIWGVGVDFDISEVKELQSQLAHAQKLESIGQLAAGIAHEINTPIQYIGDNARFLEDAFRDLLKLSGRHGCSNGSPKGAQAVGNHENGPEAALLSYLDREVPRAISQLEEGIGQVAGIVRAMKEFSHPGAVEMSVIDLNRAIESTIVISRNEWKYVADLTTDFDVELPPVSCIGGEVNQVILNLIVNAAHAIGDVVKDSGSKGRIHICTRRHGSVVEVRISDTGGGIPAAIQSKVFDPFFTTKPVGKGTGQGLAIAHSVIVQKHHGVLTFESTPGRGTTFIVRLPLACEMEAV